MSAAAAKSTTADRMPGSGEYSHRQILVIMSGLMLGLLLAALDQTIVATALTRISDDFHRPDLYSWVVTSYLLTATATTPLYGKFSDLFGRKRIFQFTIVVFLLGSILSGLSQSMYQLIAFRAVQGLGAGGLMSLALSIVADVIPPRDRGRYQGYFGGIFGSANILGPLVGGFLVDGPGWRWIFYVNVPLGAVALFVINRVLKLDHTPRKAHIDWFGSTLLIVGVSGVLIAVSQWANAGHLESSSIAFLSAGALSMVSFIFWEKHDVEPILPMRMFKNDVFRVTTSLAFITSAVMVGSIIFLPQYLQTVGGIGPTLSGLRLLPLMGGLLLSSIVSGHLITRTGHYKKFIVIGTALVTLGIILLTQVRVDTGFWELTGIIFIVGLGLGLFMQTTILVTQNSVAQSDIGVATASISFFRTLGGAIGAAGLGAVLIARSKATEAHDIAVATKEAIAAHGNNAASIALGKTVGTHHAFVDGMDRAFMWSIPLGVIGFILALRLREIPLRTSNQTRKEEPSFEDSALVD